MGNGKCIICNHKLNNVIFSMQNMPSLVQNMPKIDEINSDYGMKLDLYECSYCGLIQFDCEPVYYYKDVIRAVGLSDTMKKLRHDQYQVFFDLFNLKGKKVWEVGCGGGEFLELWKEFDVDIFGVENNENLVKKACEKELSVTQGFVNRDYQDVNGPFDAFVSFNYLEHQPDPTSMINGIYNNLKPGGVGLVTVPSFEYFIEKASYYEFMRDHIAYYTEGALSNLFLQNGFEVLSTSRFNGDTTQIIVRKRIPIQLPDFEGQKREIENKLNTYVNKHADIKRVVVWGASHQALTMLATLQLEFSICYVVDSSPLKQGFYTPVSHLEIKAPNAIVDTSPDLIIVMAPAFSEEIANQVRKISKSVNHILAIKDDKVMEM